MSYRLYSTKKKGTLFFCCGLTHKPLIFNIMFGGWIPPYACAMSTHADEKSRAIGGGGNGGSVHRSTSENLRTYSTTNTAPCRRLRDIAAKDGLRPKAQRSNTISERKPCRETCSRLLCRVYHIFAAAAGLVRVA